VTPSRDVWEASVGFLPHKVTVYEEPARNGTLYLRWRKAGNWGRKSLQRPLRTPRGRIDPETQKWALQQAERKYAELVSGVPVEERAPTSPVTLSQGLEKVTDPATGKYPTDTDHRREVEREFKRAVKHFGGDTTFESIKRRDIRGFWRWRILELHGEGHTGLRGAEITVARFLAVAAWLRDEEMIPLGSCQLPRSWKAEFRKDWLELTESRALPTPNRPRHTLEEMRAIMAKAGEVEPRLELALTLGAEKRLGQVIRARRPDLDLEHRTFTIYGRGHKQGEVVKLTDGQYRIAVYHLTTGYLRELEGKVADYPLFPAGELRGWLVKGEPGIPYAPKRNAEKGSVVRDVLDDWFHAAERLAGVPVIKGRGAYGLKRQSVDAAKALGISREGLQRLGGWADTQMPDRIYADQQMDYARDEARDTIAKIRGEKE
jgi:integrase